MEKNTLTINDTTSFLLVESHLISKKLKVLLVEDNILLQRINRFLLEDLGYEVIVREDGAAAINFFKNNTCSLILMDVHMPIMDGLEATQYLRTVCNLKIPIIALTTDLTEETVEACLKVGMNAVSQKPFEPEKLKKLIERYTKTLKSI